MTMPLAKRPKNRYKTILNSHSNKLYKSKKQMKPNVRHNTESIEYKACMD